MRMVGRRTKVEMHELARGRPGPRRVTLKHHYLLSADPFVGAEDRSDWRDRLRRRQRGYGAHRFTPGELEHFWPEGGENYGRFNLGPRAVVRPFAHLAQVLPHVA